MEWLAIFFSKDLLDPGIKPASCALAGMFFTRESPGNYIFLKKVGFRSIFIEG